MKKKYRTFAHRRTASAFGISTSKEILPERVDWMTKKEDLESEGVVIDFEKEGIIGVKPYIMNHPHSQHKTLLKSTGFKTPFGKGRNRHQRVESMTALISNADGNLFNL